MHILVVDDDSVVRMTLRTVLTSDGHTVVLAADGDDALVKLAQTEVDMVISDVYMPNLNGVRLRNAVRAMREYAKLPFLFISGYDDKQTVESVSDTTLDGFFKKGRPLTELLAWITYLTTPVEKRPLYSPNQNAQPTPGQQQCGREQRGNTRAQLL